MNEDLPFNALADPVRRSILSVLAEEGECNAGALADRIPQVGRTAVSMHLRVLRDAGLIKERREGRFRYYSVQADGVVRDVIQTLQALFQVSLDDAKAVAEAAEPDAASESA